MSQSTAGKQVFVRFDDARHLLKLLQPMRAQWDEPGNEMLVPDIDQRDIDAFERVIQRLEGMIARHEAEAAVEAELTTALSALPK